MSSETESSNSSRERQKHKRNKKHKRKSDKYKCSKAKKEKRHKQSKRSKRANSTDSEVAKNSQSPVQVKPSANTEVNIENDLAFGPALPPHLLKCTEVLPALPAIIGPVMPGAICNSEQQTKGAAEAEISARRNSESDDEADLADTYGPLPIGAGKMSATQVELEQRALELKLAAIGGDLTGKIDDQAGREEWMIELPSVGLKTGLAALSNMKRTFHQGKERPDFSDRSSWTKTPQSEKDSQKPSTSKNVAEKLKQNAEVKYQQERDEEQERIAKKHKKKHKREESLVELHQKKLRKEQKKKEKELAASGEKPERRPFTRDVDLKLNKIDRNQTKQIVDKAKILNTKFSSGHTKYL